MKPRIKICCINSIEEAGMAIAAGASAIGLVGRMPSGPGPTGNIRQAIEEVQPFGVDVCSGIRINGKLDQRKLEDFISNVLSI